MIHKNMPTKIAIVTPVFPPYHGGMAQVSFHHARVLFEESYDVTVITPKYPEALGLDVPKFPWKTEYVQPAFSYGNAALLPGLKKRLSEFSHCILHYPFFGGAENCYRWKLKEPEKKLFIYYHMDPYGTGLRKVFFSLYKRYYLSKILGVSDKIFVTSEDYALHSSLKPYFTYYQKKFFVIPCGVDIKHFHPESYSKKYFEELHIGNFQKHILFVGGLDKAHYFKGVDVLLKAAARIKDGFALIIVGKGDLLPVYKKTAQKLGISKKVFFFENVSYEDLPKFYESSDVLVLPSINSAEAFGVVLLEGMACAKPVIASNLPGVRSVVEGSVTGILVEPGDVDDLADAIETIIQKTDLAQSMGEKGRLRAEQNYSWEKVREKLLSLFV